MGTCNFCKQDKFKLIVYNDNYDYETAKKDFESDFDNDFNEDTYRSILEDNESYAIEDIEEQLANFNTNLKYHKLELKGGYYSSFQIYVTNILDIDWNDEKWDNEDSHWYFGQCLSLVKKQYNAELKKINKILTKITKENSCMIELNILGRFSNGEVIYQRA